MGLFDSMFSPNSAGLLNFGNPYGQFPEDPRKPHYAGGLAGNFPPMTDMGGTPEQTQLTPFDLLQNPATPYANMGAFQPIPQAQMQPGAQAPAMPAPQTVGYAPGATPQQDEAALPPNATPTQGQMTPQQTAQYFPQQQAQQPMPTMDNAPGFIENLVAAMNPALGAQNTAKRNQAQMARALYGALQQRGMSPQQAFAVAQAAATDPKMAETLLPQALGLKPPTTIEGVIADDMYKNPQRGGIAGGLDAIKKLKAAEAEGTNAGKVTGERQATAEMDLPGAVAQAQEGLRLIGELRAHPGRKQIGWHDVLGSAPLVPSTKGYDAQTMLDQIKGGAFLEAFKALKGGGQITEVEGKKATAAIARMDRAQSKAEFDKALSDYEGVIKLGIDRANQQAGRAAPNEFRGNAVKPGVYDWSPNGGMKQRGGQ